MSKKAIITLLSMAAALLILSGCAPTCDPLSLVAPVLVSPDWREVVDGSAASLEWSYPDASCEPEDFEIILSQDRDFNVIELAELVPGDNTSWTAPVLDDAEEYFWRVRAKVGSSYGPYSSELRSFFTGPTCSAADLVRPTLLYPAGGGIFQRDYDSLEWEWPISSCIPESYRVEVSMDEDFVDTTYNGGTGTPGTRWGFGSTPPAATHFWWRISAYADGVYSSPSAVHTFYTDPICSGSSLQRPVALTPLDDEVVSVGNPEFSWSYPDSTCAPEGFHLFVSHSPDMSSMALEADNPTISDDSFQAGVSFPDCSEYYWQVSVYSEGVESLPSYVDRFVVDTGSCGCTSGSIIIPTLNSPGSYEILPDTAAHLSWSNPGGCFPDGAAVQIATEYDFDDAVETTFPGEFVVAYDPPALDPATQYRWKAAYYIDEGSGPVLGEYSGPNSFFTGPECALLSDVAAPELLGPADGAVVNSLTPPLTYTPGAPGCIPDGYLVHLHTTSDFSDPNLLSEYAFPATTVLTSELTDCQTYYWSVTAVQDGGYGPESEVRSFSVDESGSCLPGVPARAIKNNFCREGTYPEYFKALWTFETGDPALAIARNPFSTYLQLMVLDKKTNQPLEPVIKCWSLFNAFDPGFFPSDDQTIGKQLDFKDLPVVNPPPTPVPTPTPTPVPKCNVDMDPKACDSAGGKYNYDKNFCSCNQ